MLSFRSAIANKNIVTLKIIISNTNEVHLFHDLDQLNANLADSLQRKCVTLFDEMRLQRFAKFLHDYKRIHRCAWLLQFCCLLLILLFFLITWLGILDDELATIIDHWKKLLATESALSARVVQLAKYLELTQVHFVIQRYLDESHFRIFLQIQNCVEFTEWARRKKLLDKIPSSQK